MPFANSFFRQSPGQYLQSLWTNKSSLSALQLYRDLGVHNSHTQMFTLDHQLLSICWWWLWSLIIKFINFLNTVINLVFTQVAHNTRQTFIVLEAAISSICWSSDLTADHHHRKGEMLDIVFSSSITDWTPQKRSRSPRLNSCESQSGLRRLVPDLSRVEQAATQYTVHSYIEQAAIPGYTACRCCYKLPAICRNQFSRLQTNTILIHSRYIALSKQIHIKVMQVYVIPIQLRLIKSTTFYIETDWHD